MAGYLMSNNTFLKIENKKELFSYRNKMVNIPAHYKSRNENIMCQTKCGEIENMEHIYNCQILNNNITQRGKYENIYNGSLGQQVNIYKKTRENIEKRKKYISE